MITAQALLDKPPPLFGCKRCEALLRVARRVPGDPPTGVRIITGFSMNAPWLIVDHRVAVTYISDHNHTLKRAAGGCWESDR